MPIIVNSPYSGQPVKIRDQDIGRAVRDEEGRIFYAVKRSDGSGYYGSPTRQGSPKDEQRYIEMQTKGAQAQAIARQQVLAVHDATGRPRRNPARLAVLLIILLGILAAVAFVAVTVLEIDIWPAATQLQPPRTIEPMELPEPGPPAPMSSDAGAAPEAPDAADDSEFAVSSLARDLFADALPLFDDDVDPPFDRSTEGNVASATLAAVPRVLDPAFTTTATGLSYRVLRAAPGEAPVATAGSYVLIHYTVKLPSGQVLDSSVYSDEETASPIGFVLWSGQVIRAWDEGIAGMKVGEKRELVVPPHLVAGGLLQGGPTGTTGFEALNLKLHFEIELVDVLPGVVHTTTRAGTVGGRVAAPGAVLELHYRAYLHDTDRLFDDSRQRPGTSRFRLGSDDLIQGLNLGLIGMKEGEHRTLVNPPYLAYGHRGVGTVIPPNSTLRYEIELVGVID
jgi:FKBP-type peptidyl-prolyl cis-trans isomerase